MRDDYIAQKYSLPSDKSKWTRFIKKERTGYPKQLRINPSKADSFANLFE